MGRRKLRMEFIRNKARRKATFDQRKRNLFKKTFELATLCGISICTIVYGPEIDGCPSEPETWPQNHGEVRRVIDKFKSRMTNKRSISLNLGDFYKGRIEQLKKQTARVRSQNEARFRWINELPLDSLREVLGTLDRNIGVLKTRVELIKKESLQIIEAPAAAPEMIDCPNKKKMGSRSEGITTNNMQQPIYVNPLDTFLPMQYSYSDLHATHQIVPIDQIPMTMSFNGCDYSKIGNASGNNFMYPPSMVPKNNDPTAVMMENQFLNSSFGAPSMMPPYYVYAPGRMQPMLPYVHGPMVHPSVSSGMQSLPPNYDFSDFLANSKKYQ